MHDVITQMVPRKHWMAYFQDLSLQFAGWSVTILVCRDELGCQTLASGTGLQGISYEPAGSMAGDILIEGGEPDLLMHRVAQPRVVMVADTEPGAEIDLKLESEDGTTTLVSLRRNPGLPPGHESTDPGSLFSPRSRRGFLRRLLRE